MGSVIHTVYPDGRPASCHLSVSDHMAVHHMWLSLLDILYHCLANFSCIRITWSLVKTRAAGPVPRGSDSEGLIQMRPGVCISDSDACWGRYCWSRGSGSEGLMQMRPGPCISDSDACWGWHCCAEASTAGPGTALWELPSSVLCFVAGPCRPLKESDSSLSHALPLTRPRTMNVWCWMGQLKRDTSLTSD